MRDCHKVVSTDHNFSREKRAEAPSSGTVSAKVEVAVLGSPSLIVLMVSMDVKQH